MVKKTTVDGDTVNVYDPLDRLISVTTPDGETETFEYDGVDQIVASTDKGGHTTRYTYDGNGNVTSATDAKGNVTTFEYDIMDNLSKVTLHRVDEQDGVDEYEVTLYEYDGRGLQTKVVDALGNVTVHEYDGNWNLVKTTDPDGYVTEYTMDALDLIEHINYNGGKQVDYAYNKTGDLVKMDDWSGTSTYEVDLLHQLTATTDRLGKHVAYTYDGVGNQTSVSYPDGTTATKEYDLVHNLTTVIEEDGRTTSYTYDGMRRVTHMDYPDGWQEDYHYDSIGQLLAIEDTDPTQKDMKQQKNTFEYDVCGNMIHEYMRGNGTGETTTDVTYTYDELHRVTSAKELYGNTWRNYQYDSLSNLTWEDNSNSVHYDYKMNNLNQVTEKHYSTNDKEGTVYTYDKRGNLVLEEYGKFNGNANGQKRQTVAEYTYDETNKMVKGVNSIGESSSYLFNGRNALVEQTWHIAKNGYGYHDVDAGIEDPADTTNGKGGNGSGGKGHGNGNGQGNGNGSGDKPTGTLVGDFSTVVKQFVIDYTVETMDPLMEHEVNGLDYRYVYGNERLSVNISPIPNGAGHIVESGTVGQQIRLYYHQDLRGTVDYLTSPVSQKVESWTHYNEWGEIVHNAVLKTGYRELDLVKNYTGHDFDAVLNMYYAKARMYDAENRRFVSIDPILDGTKYDLKDYTTQAINFTAYVYVRDNPLRWIDPLGLALAETTAGVNLREQPNTSSKILSLVPSGAKVIDLGSRGTGADGYSWTYVNYNGIKGWIAKTYLRSINAYVTENVNFRNGASTKSDPYYVLQKGTSVTDLGKRYDGSDGYRWAYVEHDGVKGWIAEQYLFSENKEPDTQKGDTSTIDVQIYPEMDSIENVIAKIEALESKAAEHLNTTDKKKISLAAINFIRQFGYRAGNWPDVAGPVDEEFISYIKDSEVYSYFEKMKYVSDVNSEATLDIRHFAATLSAQYFSTSNIFGSASIGSKGKAIGVGEKTLDALSGWAGDLQTLIRYNILPQLGTSATYQDVYDVTTEMLLNPDQSSSQFSLQDFISDVDAINLTRLINKNTSFAEAMKKYYVTEKESNVLKRYTLFKESLILNAQNPNMTEYYLDTSAENVRKYVSSYTQLKFMWLVVWPLYGETEEDPAVSEIPRNVYRGAGDAFVDLIWNLSEKE